MKICACVSDIRHARPPDWQTIEEPLDLECSPASHLPGRCRVAGLCDALGLQLALYAEENIDDDSPVHRSIMRVPCRD